MVAQMGAMTSSCRVMALLWRMPAHQTIMGATLLLKIMTGEYFSAIATGLTPTDLERARKIRNWVRLWPFTDVNNDGWADLMFLDGKNSEVVAGWNWTDNDTRDIPNPPDITLGSGIKAETTVILMVMAGSCCSSFSVVRFMNETVL